MKITENLLIKIFNINLGNDGDRADIFQKQ